MTKERLRQRIKLKLLSEINTEEEITENIMQLIDAYEKQLLQAKHETMVEFAKQHVKAALEAAAEKVEVDEDELEHGLDDQVYFTSVVIDSNSILNAYPYELIK